MEQRGVDRRCSGPEHGTLMQTVGFAKPGRCYPSICVSPQIEIACPEIVLPRGLHINRI